MLLALRYPATFEESDGTTIIRFRDLPEAISEGVNNEDALASAVDCLDTALHFRMKEDMPIPSPSGERPGEIGIVPTTDMSMRVALYQSYRASGLTFADFARRIDMNPARVREIMSTHRAFNLRKVGEALRRVGKPVVLSIDAA